MGVLDHSSEKQKKLKVEQECPASPSNQHTQPPRPSSKSSSSDLRRTQQSPVKELFIQTHSDSSNQSVTRSLSNQYSNLDRGIQSPDITSTDRSKTLKLPSVTNSSVGIRSAVASIALENSSPSPLVETLDWSTDRRFRRTTLLVAAASASAANAAAALAHSKCATKYANQQRVALTDKTQMVMF